MATSERLILMVGLPRSGKSTKALLYGYPIVCPDAVRLALHGKTFLKEAEFMVWPMAVLMVKALFAAGHEHVVLDATNHTLKRRQFWYDAGDWQIGYCHITATKEECIARARAEQESADPPNHFDLVPVIERMADAWEDVTTDEWTAR
jgi:predicted kinase